MKNISNKCLTIQFLSMLNHSNKNFSKNMWENVNIKNRWKNVKKIRKGWYFINNCFFNLNKNNTNLHLLLSWSGKWPLPLWNLICNLKYNAVVTSFISVATSDYNLLSSRFSSLFHSIQNSELHDQRPYLIWYKHKSYFTYTYIVVFASNSPIWFFLMVTSDCTIFILSNIHLM